jgi:hypothetical protein
MKEADLSDQLKNTLNPKELDANQYSLDAFVSTKVSGI